MAFVTTIYYYNIYIYIAMVIAMNMSPRDFAPLSRVYSINYITIRSHMIPLKFHEQIRENPSTTHEQHH